MTETIESLDNRITNIEAKLGVVVNSLEMILRQFENAERALNTSHGNMRYTSEDVLQLGYNVAYLKDVGDGEAY